MRPSFRKFISEWGYPSLGIALLAFLTILSLNTILVSQGFGRQPDLRPADINQLLSPTPKKDPVITKPKRILIPAVNLGLDIIDSTIKVESNEWPLSDTAAHYANFTPGLGSEKGTLLMYGHNTWSVMQKTGSLKIGDELVLVDQNDRIWRFIMTKEEIIVPENVGFIYEDVPFRVVMFTCNGWNDQYRRLLYFTPA